MFQASKLSFLCRYARFRSVFGLCVQIAHPLTVHQKLNQFNFKLSGTQICWWCIRSVLFKTEKHFEYWSWRRNYSFCPARILSQTFYFGIEPVRSQLRRLCCDIGVYQYNWIEKKAWSKICKICTASTFRTKSEFLPYSPYRASNIL